MHVLIFLVPLLAFEPVGTSGESVVGPGQAWAPAAWFFPRLRGVWQQVDYAMS